MSMLCAACGEPVSTDAEPCPHCNGVVRLQDRYVLEAAVGQGAAGTTYRARDRQGTVVAVKEMALRKADPEVARRMEREARVLSELHHDRIPEYVEHFTQGVGKKQVFYLVQSFVEGPTLAQEMERRRYSEAEVVAILAEVCGVLTYLHGLRPPVVHRDIKLKNLIRRATDGRLVLIDFGAVRDAAVDPRSGGSTVAGTYGYMAPEQYLGQASPQSDLYALGVLAVVLLSRRDPLDLVKPDHSLDWRPHVHAAPGLAHLIDDLLKPEPEQRPASAEEVARRLERIQAGEAPTPAVVVNPAAGLRSAAVTAVNTVTAVNSVSTVTTLTSPARLSAGRSRRLAMVLALVGSPIGVHWWYLGRPLLGILSLAFVWTGIPLGLSLLHALWMGLAGEARFNARYNPLVMLESETTRRARDIETLHTLFMKGALSQEEFEREKLRLLAEQQGAQLTTLMGNAVQLSGLVGKLVQLSRLPEHLREEVKRELTRHRKRDRD